MPETFPHKSFLKVQMSRIIANMYSSNCSSFTGNIATFQQPYCSSTGRININLWTGTRTFLDVTSLKISLAFRLEGFTIL